MGSNSMLDVLESLTPGWFFQFVCTRSGEWQFRQLDPAVRRMLGLPAENSACDATALLDRVRQPARARLWQQFQLSAQNKSGFACCFDLLTADGRELFLETSAIVQAEAAGELHGTGFFYDVTVREQAVRQLEKAEQQSKVLLDNMLDAVISINGCGDITYVNQTTLQLFGYQACELIGANVSCLMGSYHARHHNSYLQHHRQTGEQRIIGTNRVVEARHKDGQLMPVELRICLLDQPDGPTYLGVIRDLRDKLRQQQEVERLELQDALTGLPNRKALQQQLNKRIDQLVLQQAQYCLICFDADDFKVVNEGYGFEYGDEFLRQSANRLATEHLDFLARTGEDEFAVLLKVDSGQSQLRQRVEALQQRLSQPVQVFGERICTGFTAGVFCFSTPDMTFAEVIRNSELALHHAKQIGRGGIWFHDLQLDAHKRQFALLDQLLKDDALFTQMFLVYQPQYDADARLVGFEALSRWRHSGDLIPPDVFIPLAERNGRIYSMGLWLLQQACQFIQQRQQRADLTQCRVSVNISARQFASSSFVSDVLGTVAAAGIPANLLHLELTERLLLENPHDVTAKMQQLNAAGITFSLDDFGTGYSSLSYLKQLPLTELKIDKSFIRDLPDSESDRSIVSAILRMSGGLGLSVIAEGVETERHQQSLLALGCQRFQGYFLGKPAAAEFWLARSGSAL